MPVGRVGTAESLAPVAQLDRASGYEPEGRMFESCRAHHISFNTCPSVFIVQLMEDCPNDSMMYTSLKIDVRPSETENLTLAQSKRQGDGENRFQAVASHCVTN